MATRSWWGWGTVENAVRGDERDRLTARVAALLPGADLTVHEPPALSSLDLPAPAVTPPPSLAHLCSTAVEDRAAHSHGKGFRDVVRNLQGSLDSVPDVVARPRT